jgi:hypothetical protein
MAKEEWTHVRLRKTTAERLRARIAEMRAEFYAGHQSRTPVSAGNLSVDALLCWLLDERDEHRQRARRSRSATRPAGASGPEAALESDSESERV